MSTAITSIDRALDFHPESASTAGRRKERFGILGLLAAIGNAIAASHRYEELVGRGVAPSEAVGKVYDEHFADR